MGAKVFDMKRYDKRSFHEDEEIDKKIKALMLLYDYQVFEKQLGFSKQLTLLDDWIDKFNEVEYYEVSAVFKLRRRIILKQIAMDKRERQTFLEYLGIKWRWIWRKVRNFFTS